MFQGLCGALTQIGLKRRFYLQKYGGFSWGLTVISRQVKGKDRQPGQPLRRPGDGKQHEGQETHGST